MSEYFLLFVAAFLAGLVDAIGGGGGLIQVPALFSTLPNAMPASLFGTNKLASIWGTGLAASHYARRIKLEWGAALPAACAAFVFAFAGAFTVTHVPPDWVRKGLPFILLLVAVQTFRAKHFGRHHRPLHSGRKEKVLALVTGAAIGFYDGFFGPGTGSFLIFLFIHYFGFDFLGASAAAKIVNVACNGAALLWFGTSGHVLWQIGAIMAICNIAGALLGARLAIRHGAGFVRIIFFGCVMCLDTAYRFPSFLAFLKQLFHVKPTTL